MAMTKQQFEELKAKRLQEINSQSMPQQNYPINLAEPSSSFLDSPITIGERIKTSFGNNAGNVKYLKSKGYENVEETPNGIAVTKDGKRYYLDPKGLDAGDIFSVGGALPFGGSIAGGIAGGAAGTGTAPGPGTLGGGVIGAGFGGAVGESARQLTGKLLGVQAPQPLSERASEVAIQGALGAGSEFGGRAVLEPLLSWGARVVGNKGTIGTIKSYLSGLSKEERDIAVNNPYIRDAMDGKITWEGLQKTLRGATQEVKDIGKTAYTTGVEEAIRKSGGRILRLDPKKLGINDVVAQFRGTIKPITKGSGIEAIPGLSKSEIGTLNEAIAKMRSFKGGTAQDVVNLSQDINSILKIGSKDAEKLALGLTKKFDAVASALSGNLKKQIYSDAMLPELSPVNQAYSASKDILKKILPFQKELKGGTFLKNLSNDKTGERQALVEAIEKITGKKINLFAEALKVEPKMSSVSGQGIEKIIPTFTKPAIRESLITAGKIKRLPGVAQAAKVFSNTIGRAPAGRMSTNYVIKQVIPSLVKLLSKEQKPEKK